MLHVTMDRYDGVLACVSGCELPRQEWMAGSLHTHCFVVGCTRYCTNRKYKQASTPPENETKKIYRRRRNNRSVIKYKKEHLCQLVLSGTHYTLLTSLVECVFVVLLGEDTSYLSFFGWVR